MGQVRICVDFNNVICDTKNPLPGKKMGPPLYGALDALQDLYDSHYVIIHTDMANTPSGRKAVAEWLEFYDVDYHELVGKPSADYYLDDKAVKFINWKQAKRSVGLDE